MFSQTTTQNSLHHPDEEEHVTLGTSTSRHTHAHSSALRYFMRLKQDTSKENRHNIDKHIDRCDESIRMTSFECCVALFLLHLACDSVDLTKSSHLAPFPFLIPVTISPFELALLSLLLVSLRPFINQALNLSYFLSPPSVSFQGWTISRPSFPLLLPLSSLFCSYSASANSGRDAVFAVCFFLFFLPGRCVFVKLCRSGRI